MTHDKSSARVPETGTQAARRPLTSRECEVLDFLLAVDVPGIEDLRSQAEFADARPRGAGDASIDLVIDRERALQSVLALSPLLEIVAKRGHDFSSSGGWISLLVHEGWLGSIATHSVG